MDPTRSRTEQLGGTAHPKVAWQPVRNAIEELSKVANISEFLFNLRLLAGFLFLVTLGHYLSTYSYTLLLTILSLFLYAVFHHC